MKRTSFLLLFLNLSIISFSQTKDDTRSSQRRASSARVQFGLKAGVNIASLRFDESSQNSDTRVLFHAGGLAHIHISPKFALQPEVVYSAQGGEVSDGESSINYINIPVLGRYMFDNGFRIQTGPQVGFLASSKFKYNNGTTVETEPQLKKTDFAWTLGAGFLSNSGFGVDARYNLGITDVNNTNVMDYKNRVWQFGLFYQFR